MLIGLGKEEAVSTWDALDTCVLASGRVQGSAVSRTFLGSSIIVLGSNWQTRAHDPNLDLFCK